MGSKWVRRKRGKIMATELVNDDLSFHEKLQVAQTERDYIYPQLILLRTQLIKFKEEEERLTKRLHVLNNEIDKLLSVSNFLQSSTAVPVIRSASTL